MDAPATDAAWLAGKQVAFTGRLASMTRAEAAKLIEAHRGTFVTLVSRHTSFLVVGQEGFPLTKQGRLSNKLQKGRQLEGKTRLCILPEQEFFERLGISGSSDGVHRLFSMAQLCRVLRVPRDRLRSWIRAGVVEPAGSSQGVHLFDFQQVSSVKMLSELTQAGVSLTRIRRSLEHLGKWLADVERPLSRLAYFDGLGARGRGQGNQLLVRLDEGELAEPSGQLQFDFDDGSSAVIIQSGVEPPHSKDIDWWERGCEEEEAGRFAQAEAAYRQALLENGPNPKLCFNLGNALYAQGQKGRAAERFQQAVELEPSFVEAWNNLGGVLTELGHCDQALAAFRRALALSPHYADAHYNLADTLDQFGATAEARTHWQAYIRLEPVGRWAQYARQRLARSG